MTIIADIDQDTQDRINLRGISPLQKDQVSLIPGARWDTQRAVWHTPKGWATYLAIREVFKGQLELSPSMLAWVQDSWETRVAPSLALREATDGVDGDPRLYPFQRVGVEFLRLARRGLLADGMGSGKTRSALTTLLAHVKAGENPFPALVICPNSTKIQWAREAEAVWPGLDVTVVHGTSTQRRKLLAKPSHLYIMNWESVRSHSRLSPYGSIALKRCVDCGGLDESVTATTCHAHIKELNEMTFNTVIADEAHRMKDARSQQTRAVKAATGDAEFRIALTGTPIASAPDDLWSILNWLSPEEWPSRTRFVDRMLELSYNAFGAAHVIGVKSHMREEFFGGLDPRMRRMPKDLVLTQLPPIVHERRDVEMNPKQKKAYLQMREKMLAELDDGNLLISTTPLTRVTRMLQFASSYAELHQTVDTQTGKTITTVELAEPSCKIDAFLSDLPDFGDDSIVVFAVSRKLIELLSAKLSKNGISHGLITGAIPNDERQFHMDNFQAGKTKLILCTTGAGGTGINLTAARTAVFLQRPWSMIDSQQAEARVHRIGSEVHDSILIVDYVTGGTIEETVIRALDAKSNRLEEILRDKDLLRKAIENDEDESNDSA